MQVTNLWCNDCREHCYDGVSVLRLHLIGRNPDDGGAFTPCLSEPASGIMALDGNERQFLPDLRIPATLSPSTILEMSSVSGDYQCLVTGEVYQHANGPALRSPCGTQCDAPTSS
jgi:hypothetical protein